jgi:hypothetical protein
MPQSTTRTVAVPGVVAPTACPRDLHLTVRRAAPARTA